MPSVHQREDDDPPESPLANPSPAPLPSAGSGPPTPGALIGAFVVVMAAVLALLWLRLSILTAVAVAAAAAVIAICLARGAVRPLWQIVTRSVSGSSGVPGSPSGSSSGARDSDLG